MPHDELASAYATIGVKRDTPIVDVQRAYKKLVRQWHPDQFTNDPQGIAEATSEMRLINHAYTSYPQSTSQ
jgi:curved DNA-binding protein CbpA